MTKFRRSVWTTKDEAFEHFKQKEKFQMFDEDVLRDYVRHGTIETETGVKLFFKSSVEAKIYQTLPDYLPKLRGRLKISSHKIQPRKPRFFRASSANISHRNF